MYSHVRFFCVFLFSHHHHLSIGCQRIAGCCSCQRCLSLFSSTSILLIRFRFTSLYGCLRIHFILYLFDVLCRCHYHCAGLCFIGLLYMAWWYEWCMLFCWVQVCNQYSILIIPWCGERWTCVYSTHTPHTSRHICMRASYARHFTSIALCIIIWPLFFSFDADFFFTF